MKDVNNIRNDFANLYINEDFVIDKDGGKVLELIGESFIANEDHIFGNPNEGYIKREIERYESKSLNVNDIPGETPKIWDYVSDDTGLINSNYGWMVYDASNFNQYNNTVNELVENNYSRRATMIYQRPSMSNEYNTNGMSDFCCTYGTQHFIRNKELITYVLMRSNDAWAGFRNDKAWHQHILDNMYVDLNKKGIELNSKNILWTSGSLHIYERQFYLVDHYIKTGETHIVKNDYKKLYNK